MDWKCHTHQKCLQTEFPCTNTYRPPVSGTAWHRFAIDRPVSAILDQIHPKHRCGRGDTQIGPAGAMAGGAPKTAPRGAVHSAARSPPAVIGAGVDCSGPGCERPARMIATPILRASVCFEQVIILFLPSDIAGFHEIRNAEQPNVPHSAVSTMGHSAFRSSPNPRAK